MNEDRLEHAVRNPFVRLLAILAALFFFGWLIYGLRTVLTPVFISFLIAYLLDPVVDRFEARGINRTLAIVILMVLLFLGAATFILAIALAIRDFTLVVKTDLPNWLDSALLPWLNSTALPWVSSTFELDLGGNGEADIVGGMITEVRGHLSDFVPRLAGPVRTIVTSALSGTMALLAWVANAILIPLFSFYLLRDFDGIVARIRSLVPRQYESQVVEVFGEINETISAFVRGQMLVMLILGVLYGIGLTIAKVKLGFGIGLIAGLLAVIPYLGFFAGVTMALIMSLAGGDNIWWNLIGTGITFGVVQSLEGTIITPKIVGDKVGLHPVWVILALMVGAQLLGVLGMLLAIPAAAVVRIVLKRAVVRYQQSELFRHGAEGGEDEQVEGDLDDGEKGDAEDDQAVGDLEAEEPGRAEVDDHEAEEEDADEAAGDEESQVGQTTLADHPSPTRARRDKQES